MSDRRRLLLAYAAMVALVGFCLLVSACSKGPQVPSATARVLTAAEVRESVPLALLGDSTYAEVNSVWLKTHYAQFRAEIFRHGVAKWDERFDCNHFAGYYVSLAQTKFYLSQFHSRASAQTLALGAFWYQSPRGPHAVVVALTERGTLFIEPQTGRELTLTQDQRDSAWLRLF